MASSNLYALLRSRFPREPGALCLLPEAGDPLSYAELDLQTARLAGRLRGLGVRPGERVLAQVPKSPAAVILYLACLRAGSVYVPLNDAYTDEEVRAFLVDAAARNAAPRGHWSDAVVDAMAALKAADAQRHGSLIGGRGRAR